VDWKFRPLNPGEVRFLIERHGDHKANVLTDEAVAMCQATGKALQDTHLVIDAAVSSPAGRALETALKTLHGYGTMVYTRTNDRLADTAIEPESAAAVKKAQEKVKKLELSGEEGLAQVLFDPNGEAADLMTRRGEEGADCLREIALKNPGKIFLIASHGIARIENTLMALRSEALHQPDRLAQKCQIVEVILNAGTGELVEENWLDPVPMPTT